jgi:hypothetical protein
MLQIETSAMSITFDERSCRRSIASLPLRGIRCLIKSYFLNNFRGVNSHSTITDQK